MPALVLVVLVAAVGVGVMVLISRGDKKAPSGRGSTRSRSLPHAASTSRPRNPVRKVPALSFGPRLPRWVRIAPVVLLALAVVSLLLGVTGFRFSKQETGGTVILTLDASNSMDNDDVAPSRLAAAQEAGRTFVSELPDVVRLGLVTFADAPVTLSRPTLDHVSVLSAIDDPPRGKGTLIGDGLAATLDAIEADWRDNGVRPAAILLLSDGLDTGSTVPPISAAERARAMEVPVFTVVLGSVDEGEDRGANVALLQSIATTTGAEAFTAETSGQLSSIYGSLGVRLSTDLQVSGSSSLFIVIAVAFAIAAAALVILVFVKEP